MSLIKKSFTFFKKYIIEKFRIKMAIKQGIKFSEPNYIYLEKPNITKHDDASITIKFQLYLKIKQVL